jgi:hypothetical protein
MERVKFMAKQATQGKSKLETALEELGQAEQAYEKNKCTETLEAKRAAQQKVGDIKLGKIQ